MGTAHPLYRFDLAMAILLRRPSLVTLADFASLPTSTYRSVTARAYCTLLQQRVLAWQEATREGWPLPEVDYARGTMTFYGNSRRFRIVLSWGIDDWQLRTRGQLAERRGPQACALRWVVSGYARLPDRELRTDLDLYCRTIAVLALAGLDDETIVRLSEMLTGPDQAASFYGEAWRHMSLMARRGDRLCARAIGQLARIPIPA